MKDYSSKNIRNICLLGHGGDGKTTLSEAMLFTAGAIDRQGRVEDGNTTMDHEKEETRRKISISTATASLEWKETKINLVDVPGFFDFAGEQVGPVAVCEAAVIVLSAVSGLDVGGEKAWTLCEKAGRPRFIVINQMDRDNASYDKTIAAIEEKYGSHIAPMQVPVMDGEKFIGVASVLDNKAYIGEGKSFKEVEVPDSCADELESAREHIMEAAASTDEELMEKYFDTMELSREEILKGLSIGMADGSVVPVFVCSALNRVGVQKLLDQIVNLVPAPAGLTVPGTDPKTGDAVERVCAEDQPFSARVFKTMADPFVGKLSLIKVVSGKLTGDMTIYNVNKDKAEKPGTLYFLKGKKQTATPAVCAGDICALAKLASVATGDSLCDAGNQIKFAELAFPASCMSKAVYAKKAGEEDKIFSGLNKLMEEDKTIRIEKNEETKESLLCGLGETHIDVIAKKLAEKFGAECDLRDPKIPYRESIRKPIDVEGRHKKQSGGHGQFGDVKIKFRPNDDPADTDFHFVDSVVGGTVPRNFIPAVEKGLIDNVKHGVLAGFPVVGLTAELYDGGYHPVDSSEMAFKTAARLAFKQLTGANPILLEPIYHVEVDVPDNYMGDVIGDMNKRRGRILGMDKVGDLQRVTAEAPLSEMSKYATDLRSMTQARGSFTMVFERYEEVPAMDAKKIVEAHKVEDEEE